VPHYEIVYEDGSFGVANYADDDEALAATQAHHERATKGQSSILSEPNAPKATRIVKVIRYDEPPGDLHESQTLSEDEVNSRLKDLVAGASADGVTDLRALAAGIRDLSNPFVAGEPHDSNYEAEGEELALPWA